MGLGRDCVLEDWRSKIRAFVRMERENPLHSHLIVAL